MTVASPFHYVSKPSQDQIKSAFVAVLPCGIDSKSALLESLASSLVFPAYFGFNWDALFECFRDFSWINERDIVLIHLGLPKLSQQELKIYLRLLCDSAMDWRPGEAHRFDVIFSESDREAIEKLLQDS